MKENLKASRSFFYILFFFVLILSYKVLEPYLSLVFLAFITAIIFKPVFNKIKKTFWGSTGLATGLTLITIFLTFLIPLLFVGNLVYNQAIQFTEDIRDQLEKSEIDLGNITTDEAITKANNFLEDLPFVEYTLTEEKITQAAEDVLKPASEFLVSTIVGFGTSAVDLFPAIILYVFLVSAFLPSDQKLIDFYKKLSPLPNEIDEMYISRAIAMIKSTVKGTFVIVFIQASISGLSFWIAGVEYVIFWTILMMVVGVIPLGVGIISFPVGIVVALTGNVPGGILICLTYSIVVGNIDNLLRPKLTSKEANLPSALILLGVLGGLKMFGFMGLLYGPLIMIFFMTSIEVYMKYYRDTHFEEGRKKK